MQRAKVTLLVLSLLPLAVDHRAAAASTTVADFLFVFATAVATP